MQAARRRNPWLTRNYSTDSAMSSRYPGPTCGRVVKRGGDAGDVCFVEKLNFSARLAARAFESMTDDQLRFAIGQPRDRVLP
jgi:hypothetical protein